MQANFGPWCHFVNVGPAEGQRRVGVWTALDERLSLMSAYQGHDGWPQGSQGFVF